MDPLSEIGVFVKTVELRSFTKAADRLETSSATVSRIITKLELGLGVKLLERTTRRVAPTPDGMVFYDRCRHILDDLESAKSELVSLRDTLRGTLRVILPASYGDQWIMPLLNDFTRRYPELTLNVALSDRSEDLTGGDFDVAISVGEPATDRLVARKLRVSRIVTAAAPAYLAEKGTPGTPDDLTRHNCLLYIRPGQRSKWLWEFTNDGKTLRHVAVRSNLLIDNGMSLMKAAVHGAGIIQAPDYVVQHQLNNGALVEILHEFQPPGPAIWLLFPPGGQRSTRSRMLIDQLFAMADTLPGISPPPAA
ncbi:LysR substrate-binding domain-containing protein [Castellaniella sp.]|uniref:LysR family transcriptional regulator n=1 Tax=Castellaniella sp. TaxID=1955812 RepID=UPI003C72D098